MSLARISPFFSSLVVLVLVVSVSCSKESKAESVKKPVAPENAPEVPPDATLVHLEGRFGGGDGLWGECSYKVKRESGVVSKELEVKFENAQPGVLHEIKLDGKPVGKLIVDADGEGDFELIEDDDVLFPVDFTEPKVDSVVEVVDLMQFRLKPLEKLVNLETLLAGPGTLAGEVSYKVERVVDTISREFEIKVTGAPPDTTHAVTIGGVKVADLSIDSKGKGKIEFSTKHAPLLPPSFPAEVDSSTPVQIGELYSGTLHDKLEGEPSVR